MLCFLKERKMLKLTSAWYLYPSIFLPYKRDDEDDHDDDYGKYILSFAIKLDHIFKIETHFP